jgi:hypothetical protein
VCFPSRWALTEKMGLAMEAIHAPVPGLNARLAKRIDTLFDRLVPGKLVARMNSDVMDSPELYQPPSFGSDLDGAVERGETPRVTLDNAGERLVLRMERQTLRRLPVSGAVVFTIKTHQMRLRDVVADLGLADRLRRACHPRCPPTVCPTSTPRPTAGMPTRRLSPRRARLAGHYASMLGTPMASGKEPYKRHVQMLCQWLAPRVSCQAISSDSRVVACS